MNDPAVCHREADFSPKAAQRTVIAPIQLSHLQGTTDAF
jgi:hypothetical protein